MSNRDDYLPGPAADAEVRKDGDKWTLILVRELRHPPEKVWKALTDPASLREWAPFDADRSLASVGPVKLSTVGTPTPNISDSKVTRAEAPNLLEYRWGENDMRWQLEPFGDGRVSRFGTTSIAALYRWAQPAGISASMSWTGSLAAILSDVSLVAKQ